MSNKQANRKAEEMPKKLKEGLRKCQKKGQRKADEMPRKG
jgi:hypothetical protein